MSVCVSIHVLHTHTFFTCIFVQQHSIFFHFFFFFSHFQTNMETQGCHILCAPFFSLLAINKGVCVRQCVLERQSIHTHLLLFFFHFFLIFLLFFYIFFCAHSTPFSFIFHISKPKWKHKGCHILCAPSFCSLFAINKGVCVCWAMCVCVAIPPHTPFFLIPKFLLFFLFYFQ